MHELSSTSPAQYRIIVQGTAENLDVATYGVKIVSVDVIEQTTVTTFVGEIPNQSTLIALFHHLLAAGLPMIKAELISTPSQNDT